MSQSQYHLFFNKNLEKQVILSDYYWELQSYYMVLRNGWMNVITYVPYLLLENRDSLIFKWFAELHHLNIGRTFHFVSHF